jgi:hypothetical protein
VNKVKISAYDLSNQIDSSIFKEQSNDVSYDGDPPSQVRMEKSSKRELVKENSLITPV